MNDILAEVGKVDKVCTRVFKLTQVEVISIMQYLVKYNDLSTELEFYCIPE